MKKILFSILVLAGITVTAQVKVGTNPTTINTTTTNFQVEGTTTADQFVVLKNGNVGIGTIAPNSRLNIFGITGDRLNGPHFEAYITGGVHPVYQNLNWSTDNITQSFDMYYNGSAWTSSGTTNAYQISKTLGQLRFFYATSTVAGSILNPQIGMVLDNLGNIGIGTSTPAAKLDVAGQVKISGGTPGDGKVLTSDADGLASWATPAAGGVSSVSGTAPIAVAGTTTPVISLNDAGVTNAKLADNAVNSAKIADDTVANADLTAGTGGIYKGSGSLSGATTVTLGTNDLTFTGSGTINKLGGASDINTYFQIGRTTSEADFGVAAGNGAGLANTVPGDFWMKSGSGKLTIGTGGNNATTISTSGAERVRVDGSGNVGIGTTTPAAKLDVNGQVKISGGAPSW